MSLFGGIMDIGKAALGISVSKAVIRLKSYKTVKKNGNAKEPAVKVNDSVGVQKKNASPPSPPPSGQLNQGESTNGYDNPDICTFKVLFNPESLQFSASSGGYEDVKSALAAENGKDETVNSFSTHRSTDGYLKMSVNLVFDKCDPNNAFSILDPFSISLTSSTVINVVKNLESMFGGKNLYSVQPEVELFIASIQSKYTNEIEFVWGDMCYTGVFSQVSAEYTMFNPSGDPVRAVVSLTMTIIDDKIKVCKFGSFEDAFEAEFKDKGQKVSWNTWSNAVGGILNLPQI